MYGGIEYISEEDMRDKLLYKRIIDISEDEITLENGVKLSIECTEWDCCAGGGGKFEYTPVALDAVITDVEVGEYEPEYDGYNTRISHNTITIFHNQNDVVRANATTDAGNGGYYYSVTSLRIGDVWFPFVEA